MGCKVNQVESENIKQQFSDYGYQILSGDEVADVYVVNTCAVTHVSERKSRAMLRRAKRKNPKAVVVATGCLAQVAPNLLAAMPEVDLVIGNSSKDRIAELVQNHRGQSSKAVVVGELSKEPLRRGAWCLPAYERTRAFVKIQDGCESYCSYCLVPYARGPVRSKLPEDVVREIDWLVSAGFKEIVITGIHTGMYGKDLADWDLVRLLETVLVKVQGDYRLRLSSIEPTEITKKLIELMASEKKLCRHLHIPLQSGSDRVLKLMNRRYTRGFYRDLVMMVTGRVPGTAVTSDVMVGFPTESEEDFLDTLKLIDELPFAGLHVFPYSPRPNTAATDLYPRVENQVKEQRSKALLKLARHKQQRFIESCSGQTLTVLVEEVKENSRCEGLTDNYLRAEFYGGQLDPGQFVSVRLVTSSGIPSWEVVSDRVSSHFGD